MADSPTTDWTIGLGRLGVRIRRRWRTLAAVLVLVFVAATVAGLLAPRQYSASASVTVSPIRLSTTYSNNNDINISTERAVIASRQVAAVAAAHLHPAVSAETLTSAMTVAAPSGSTVLQVTVAAPTPAQAAAWANAVADAYVTVRAQSALAAAQPSIDALNARIAAVNPKNTSTLSDLRGQVVALQHVGDGTARIIGRASVPSSPSSLGLIAYLAGGLVGGLLLGALAAIGRDVTDPRVRFADRYSDLLRRPAVVVRRADDIESARWILRAVRHGSRSTLHGPRVVAVMAPLGVPVKAVMESVAALARLAGTELAVVDEDQLAAADLENEWHYRPTSEIKPGLVLVDASRVVSEAQRAVIADASDSVLVVAARRSRVAEVAALRRLVDDGGTDKLIPVFLEGSAAAVRTRQESRRGPRPATERELELLRSTR